MEIMKKDIMDIDLQLFAEGGGAGGAAGGAASGSGEGGTGAYGSEGVMGAAALSRSQGAKNPLADVQYGKGDAPAAEVQNISPDRNAQFEALIKGEWKAEYDQRVQETVQKRLKSSKETVDRYNALAPTLELLASKYGVDAGDIAALNQAIQDDDAYYEDEAMDRGLTVSQLKEIKTMERENAELRRQMQERETKANADRLYSQWMDQSEQIKQIYPSFDVQTEMQNPQFISLLRSNIDMKTAYEVIHHDEILPAAMSFAVNRTEQKIASSIASNGRRPVENGRSNATAQRKTDVSQFTKADRQEIARRVARGERIVL